MREATSTRAWISIAPNVSPQAASARCRVRLEMLSELAMSASCRDVSGQCSALPRPGRFLRLRYLAMGKKAAARSASVSLLPLEAADVVFDASVCHAGASDDIACNSRSVKPFG